MIKLDAEYYITADTMSFQLMRKYKPEKDTVAKRKTGDETETTIGYFANVSHAIDRYRKEQMLKWAKHDTITLEQFCDRINEMDAQIAKKMSRLVSMQLEEKPKKKKTEGKKDETVAQTA